MPHWLKGVIKNVSTDCVIFGFENSSLEILLYKRAQNPSKGKWALPGGFLKQGELIEEAARRILKDTTGVSDIYLEAVGVFDDLDRFPSWRVFTIGYYALVSPHNYKLIISGTYTIETKWFRLDELPELAWDHKHILDIALQKLRYRVLHQPVGFELLNKKFTLPQLQNLYEVILARQLDKRNFRKKIIGMNLLKKLNEKDSNNKRRAAYLYKFDEETYRKLLERGFTFEL
ncbi:MAG: NUDIX hydrolase [Melioribacteraceae bacterium]|nr:NUDIX hydrolase [Melioribacteraceae bacterium]